MFINLMHGQIQIVSQLFDLFVLQLVLFLKGMYIILNFSYILAFKNIPHPNIQVKILTLFIQDRFLCKDGLILYKASMKAFRKLSLEGVSDLVGEW